MTRFLFLLILLAFSAVSAMESMAQSGTVIVANMSDNTATLIDASTGDVLATLPTGPSPHEVAVTSDGETAVITNYGNQGLPGSTLTVIDVPSLSVVKTISTGVHGRPHGIAYLPGDSLVAVTSESGGVVLIVDIENEEVVRTIETKGRASHMLSADPSGRHVYTTNILSGTISHIDAMEGTNKGVIEVAPMVEGLAVSPDGGHVWVGSNARKTVNIVDVQQGVVVDSLSGFGFPYRMAVTPDGRHTLISDPVTGEVRVVDAQSFKELKRVTFPGIEPVATAEIQGSVAPEGMVISPDSRFAYISLQGASRMAIVSIPDGRVVRTVVTGTWPDGIGYSTWQH